MILLSLTCAVLAAWGLVSPAAPGAAAARLATSDAGADVRRRPLLRLAGVVATVLITIWAIASLIGGAAAAIGLAAAVAVATVVLLITSHSRARTAIRARRTVTDACTTLAALVRVGRLPTEALLVAADDCPILGPARAVQLLGGDVAEVWQTHSRMRGHGGLAELARAWRISTQTGAPLAMVLERVAESMAAEESVRALVAGELAGPRATAKIMAFLPLAGLALGYALGGDPIAFLLQGPIGWSCLVGGVGLAAAGVLWVEALAQRAAVDG
jgi:tight adherence protein B